MSDNTKLLIIENPYDGSGRPPHGYYHFIKVVSGGEVWVMGTLSMDFSRQAVGDIAKMIADEMGVKYEWQSEAAKMRRLGAPELPGLSDDPAR